jgi:hypothetical protein
MLFFSLLSLIVAAGAHTCIHDQVQSAIDVSVDAQAYPASYAGAVTTPTTKRQSSATTATNGLRVHFDTFSLGASRLDCTRVGQTTVVQRTQFTCTQEDVLDQDTKNLLLRVLADLRDTAANLFSIVRADKLTVNGAWCHDDQISVAKYGSASSDAIRSAADMLVVVTAWPTSGSTLAWCGYCRTDQFGRPVAAHMNFGPAALNAKPYKYVYATALHELMHGLGFTSGRFQKLLNDAGRVFSGTSRITLGSPADGTKSVFVISSPRVVRAARAHYGCDSLEGLELEDTGSDGAGIGSHWETRVMTGEVMAPQIASDASAVGPRISPMTLAYFEDMGVYRADYRFAGNYGYGLQQGCDFALRPARTRIAAYKCPLNLQANRCNPVGDGYSSCQWFTYEQDLPLFQRPLADKPRMGGQQYEDFNVEAGTYQSCLDPTLEEESGQKGGENSFCLDNTVVQRNWIRSTFGGGCYQIKCPAVSGGPAPAPSTPAPVPAPAPSTPAPVPSTPAPVPASELSTFCAARGDGDNCSADLKRVIRCVDGVGSVAATCATKCVVKPPSEPDVCEATTPPSFCTGKANGAYCSADLKQLMRCANEVTSAEVCATKCSVKPPGVPDACEAPAPAVNFRLFASCEACTKASGLWCDSGYDAVYNRKGACVNPATEKCSAGTKLVTSEGACYVSCSFTVAATRQTFAGKCRAAAWCAGKGAARKSSDGAVGCRAEPGPVICCIPTGTTPTKRSIEEAQEADEVAQSATSNKLQVRVGTQWVECPADGGDVDVNKSQQDALHGKLRCPKLRDVCCPHLNGCNNNGRCVNGACMCKTGFSGAACDARTAAPELSLPQRSSSLSNFAMDEVAPVDDTPTGPTVEGVPVENDFASVELPGEKVGPMINAPAGPDLRVAIGVGVAVVLLFLVAAAIGFFVWRRRSARTFGRMSNNTAQ